MTQEEQQNRYSHPMVRKYDKRANAGQLDLERQRQRELRSIRRDIKRLLAELETATLTPGQVAAKRLRYDILDKERDRLEGKPFTKAEPPKEKNTAVLDRARKMMERALEDEPPDNSSEPLGLARAEGLE
jgi:hypothetical protein